MITLTEYWHDRESRFRMECTGEIRANAQKTVDAANKLLVMAEVDGIVRCHVSSGWRPQSVNDATKNAAKGSNHLIARAVDIVDADRRLAQWCVSYPEHLAACGLWMEDPRWCATWVHLQTVPPKSGKRIYIPNTKPPSAPELLGQKPIPAVVRA